VSGAFVVDTSALLAVLLQEPEGDLFLDRIATAERAHLATPTWLETAIVLQARKGDGAEADLDLFLQEGPFRIEPFDITLARHAQVAWQKFGKGRHRAGLNLGDCFSYALAAGLQLPLLFKGEDFHHTDITTVMP
jgi:ribonuclease VapC